MDDDDNIKNIESIQNIEILNGQLATSIPVNLVDVIKLFWLKLQHLITNYIDKAGVERIITAFLYANKLHEGQLRKSGEPYIIHPLAVAVILAEIKMDETSIISAILHDVVEDTNVPIKEIDDKFGQTIALIVDGLTKLSKVQFKSTQEKLAENFRKMVLAMSKDIRVIIIKIADRTHNMRTIKALSFEKKQSIAQETLDIYAPLAGRLGMYKLKAELEDLCLKELKPSVYFSLVSRVMQKKGAREDIIIVAKNTLTQKLAELNIKCSILGRAKHFYSIYKKMSEKQIQFEDIYDLFALRILVSNISECYETLGIVHNKYKPVPGRFKDYIAMPKVNLYQSLHTTVLVPKEEHCCENNKKLEQGELVEFQIRTYEMHDICENGIAAHWTYKENRKENSKNIKSTDDMQKFGWLQQIVKHQMELSDPNEFLEAVKIDLFDDEVYVFSPKNEVFALQRGATCLDFAFNIHSDVGLRTSGAKINGRITPLRTVLNGGDFIEIIVSPKIRANKDWINIVTTTKARNKIRQWLRSSEREEAKKTGMNILNEHLEKLSFSIEKAQKAGLFQDLNQKFPISGYDDLLIQIGYGKLDPKITVHKLLGLNIQDEQQSTLSLITNPVINGENNKLLDNQIKYSKLKNTKNAENSVKVQGMNDVAVRFAKCCQPLPGQTIIGFVSRGHGITVHATSCEWAMSIDPVRKVDCSWTSDNISDLVVRLRIQTHDKPGILATITKLVANSNLNIISAEVQTTPDKRGIISLKLQIKHIAEFRDIYQKLESLDGIISVERLTG